MTQYVYEGPVMEFEHCIESNWKAYTYAQSPAKAKSNLMYRFKKSNNRTQNTKISLPGKIQEVL